MFNKDGVQVSIICTAYNHEKYIRKCLDGFVIQKGVTFEIIIHDDASTDSTADIIHEYEQKYPGIFKPIYQKENQYSQHTPFTKEYIVPLITGKYVALCEGDDYWVDEYKLKKQFDALEANPDCYMCLHNVEVVNEDGSSSGKSYPSAKLNSIKLTSDYFFQNFESLHYFHTSCYFLNSQKYIEYIIAPPKFRQVAPVGDQPLLMYFLFHGNAYYLSEVMSNYRSQSIGSWTMRINSGKTSNQFAMQKDFVCKMRNMIDEFATYSNNKYNNEISFFYDAFNKRENVFYTDRFWYLIDNKDYKTLFKDFSKSELKSIFNLSNKEMLKMKLHIILPKFF